MVWILAVDDEPSILAVIEKAFGARDRKFILAATAEQALKKAEEVKFIDLALVDKNLPDRSGLELIKDLKRLHPETELVVMTAYESLESAIEAIRIGIFDYVTKPFDISVLGLRIDNALEKVRLKQDSQLRQTQKMEAIGQLAAGVAHDFNNLLLGIFSHADVLAKNLGVSNPNRDDLMKIQRAAERAAKLTAQLSAFGRRKQYPSQTLDVNEVITNMVNDLRRVVGANIEVVTSFTTDATVTRIDPDDMAQILLNLAINARDAMPRGGKIFLETSKMAFTREDAFRLVGTTAERFICLAVSDTGHGMTTEVANRIFEPYFTTKEVGKGSGLGLSMVYGVVRQSGGNVRVYSEPGKGTTFRVFLPVVDQAARDEKERDVSETTQTGRGETILLVEDDDIARDAVLRVLLTNDYKVYVARDANEALNLAKKLGDRIQLLLTDVVMPQMSGQELMEQLRKMKSDLPALLMSGYTELVMPEHNLIKEGVNFLQKPFTNDTLLKRIKRLLDASTGSAGRTRSSTPVG